MTGPRLDFGAINNWIDGPGAAQDNAAWVKSQADALKRLRDELAAMHSGQATTPLGGSVDPNGKVAQVVTQQPQARSAPIVDTRTLGEIGRMGQDELIGRAKALGIENPETMPTNALQAAVYHRRFETGKEDHGILFTLAGQYARFGLAAASTINHFVGQIGKAASMNPGDADAAQANLFFRDWSKDVLGRLATASGTREKLAQLDENVRANLTGNEQNGYLVRAAGDLAGVTIAAAPFVHATIAALGAGVAPVVTGRIAGSPIGRGALAGAVAAAGLDIGSDKPWVPSFDDFSSLTKANATIGERLRDSAQLLFGSRMMNVATGSLLGAAMGKLEQAFGTRQGKLNEQAANEANAAAEAENLATATGSTDARADWYNRFIRGPEPIDVEFTVEDIVPGQATAPSTPTSALETQYLRRLGPGEAPTSVVPEAPVAPTGGAPLTDPGERVVAAAVRRTNGQIMTGESHGQIISRSDFPAAELSSAEDGFMTSSGRFVSREEAGRLGGKTGAQYSEYLPENSYVEPQSAPAAPGGPRLLQGPLQPQASSDIAAHQASIRYITEILNQGGLPAAEVENLTMYRQSYADRVKELERDPSSRQTTTFADAAPAIIDLKANIRDMTQRLEMLPNDHPAVPYLAQELEAASAKLIDLRRAAGGAPYTSSNDPSVDSVYDRRNQPSPATPARQLVEAAGTKYRNKQGEPVMFLHGTARVYDTVAREYLNKTQNLYDGGFYASTSPTVTGGDITDFEVDNGYAGGRADQLNRERTEAVENIKRAQQMMNNFETMGPASGLTPEIYETLKQNLVENQEFLNSVGTVAANVRPIYIAATNLFQADEQMVPEEALRIMAQGIDHPVFANVRDAMIAEAEAYRDAVYKDRSAGVLAQTNNDLYNGFTMFLEELGMEHTAAQAQVNQFLEDIGYHGIEYSGGMRLRRTGEKHVAVNIFDPSRVVHAYLGEEALAEHAAALGVNLSKQNAILESPAMPDLIGEAQPDDSTVIKAQVTAEPGGFHVLKGVSNPSDIIQKLASEEFSNSLAGALKAFRVVPGPTGSLDLLTSSLGEITDEMVAQYAATGVFVGMDVTKPKGGTARVLQVYDDGMVKVQTKAQSRKGPRVGNAFRFDQLSPSLSSGQVIEAPDLYAEFRSFAMLETGQRINSSGQVYEPSWFDDSVFHRLPELTREFLDNKGITDIGARGAIARYFDMQRIEDAKALDPEYSAMMEEALEARDAVEPNYNPTIHEYAALRGFYAVPSPNGVGYVLEDMLSPMKYPMADEEAVRTFLNTFQRGEPDLNPATPVPTEAGHLDDNSGDLIADSFEAHESKQFDQIADWQTAYESDPYFGEPSSQDWENAFFDAGGGPGGRPPGGGGSGASGGYTGGVVPFNRPVYRIGSGQKLLGSGSKRSFARQQLEHLSGNAAAIQQAYTNALTGLFTPMRTFFSNMEEALHAAGAKELTPWKDWDTLNRLITTAHNEAYQPLEEIGKEIAVGRAKFYRNGQWMRIWSIPSQADRYTQGFSIGMNPAELRSMDNIDATLRAMYGDQYDDAVTQFKEFFSKVVQEQARGRKGPASYPDPKDYPAISHYVQHAADTNMRLLNADPRVVLPDFIRSYTFNKHAAVKWNDTHDLWMAVKNLKVDGQQPFAKIANDMLDWMDYVQRGHVDGGDWGLQALNEAYNATIGKLTGAPITKGETRKVLRGLQTGFYRSVMGLRVHVMARDAIQPLLSTPWVGADNLAYVYKTLMTPGSREWDAMVVRARDAGVVERGIPQFESPGTFEGIVEDTHEASLFTQEQRQRRETLANWSDQVRDFVGRNVRGGVHKYGDTLKFYTKQGEIHNIIVGESAYRNFTQKFSEWQAQRLMNLETPLTMPGFDSFAKSIGLDSWAGPERRAIEGLVNGGAVEEAAYTFMRMVAQRTQFAFGGRHAPRVSRTTHGRLFNTLGNFSLQAIDTAKNIARFQNPRIIMKSFATLAAITGTLEAMKFATGWNFSAMNPIKALMFTGGPAVEAAADVVSNAQAAVRVYNTNEAGREANYDDQRRLQKLNVGKFALGLAQQFNPFAGINYDLRGAEAIADSPNPGAAAAQFLMLGNTGLRQQVGQDIFREQVSPYLLNETETDTAITRRMPEGVAPEGAFIQTQVDSGSHGKGRGAF